MATASRARDRERRGPGRPKPYQKESAEERARLREADAEMFARLDSVVFRQFGRYLRPYRKAIVLAALAVVAFSLANVAIRWERS